MGAGNPTISPETETQVPAACQPQPWQPRIIKLISQLQKPTRRITDTWIIDTGKRETRYQLVKVHQTIRQPHIDPYRVIVPSHYLEGRGIREIYPIFFWCPIFFWYKRGSIYMARKWSKHNYKNLLREAEDPCRETILCAWWQSDLICPHVDMEACWVAHTGCLGCRSWGIWTSSKDRLLI